MDNNTNMTILSTMYCNTTKEQVDRIKQKEQIDKIKQLCITKTNVLEELTKAEIPYTWETVNDYAINDKKRIIEVRLYLPGNILYGRTCYETLLHTDDAHLIALYEALSILVPTKSQSQPVQQQSVTEESIPLATSNQNKALSNDEIMNIVQQQSAAAKETSQITTAEQMKNDPRTEIPFEEVSLEQEELNKILGSHSQSPVVPEKQTPQNGFGFTQEQIQKVLDFKKTFNVTTDEMFGSYINAWNNKYSKKEDLNGTNIESFLKWVSTLGKAPY